MARSRFPVFSQTIHAVVDETCPTPALGSRWTFSSVNNTMNNRLLASSQQLKAIDADGTTCLFTVLEEIHCVVGPDMGDPCPPPTPLSL